MGKIQNAKCDNWFFVFLPEIHMMIVFGCWGDWNVSFFIKINNKGAVVCACSEIECSCLPSPPL